MKHFLIKFIFAAYIGIISMGQFTQGDDSDGVIQEILPSKLFDYGYFADSEDGEETREKRYLTQSKTITVTNSGELPVRLQCGKSRGSSTNPISILASGQTTTFKLKPTHGENSFYCTASSNGKMMSFTAYDSTKTTSKTLPYMINNKGLYLKGILKQSWT